MNLNKAFIIGKLTRDPELKVLPSGSSIASMGVATNRTYKERDGAQKEETTFHNIIVFGKQADSVAQFLKKGTEVMVEGRLQTQSWEKDGVKHSKTEIVADRVQFGCRAEKTEQTSAAPQKPSTPAYEYPEEDINPEDIPF